MAYLDLEKRISEHDTCVVEQKPEELVKVRAPLIVPWPRPLVARPGRGCAATLPAQTGTGDLQLGRCLLHLLNDLRMRRYLARIAPPAFFSHDQVTLELIHEAEATLADVKGRAAEAAEALQDAKLAQRRAEAAAKGEARSPARKGCKLARVTSGVYGHVAAARRWSCVCASARMGAGVCEHSPPPAPILSKAGARRGYHARGCRRGDTGSG